MGHQYCDCQEAVRLRALFHDLGNHLATFSYILEAVDEESGMLLSAQHHVPMMKTQTARMLDLLREAVGRDRQPENVSVRALISELVTMANARDQATVILRDSEDRWLCTHPAALWRIVANVVDNAVRAAGPAGRVEISVHNQPPKLVIEVVDDGPGFGKIPAGAASLGLGIAVSLAEECGGKVKMSSVHPHGVRVRLEFRDLAARYATADHRSGRA